jgi:hypothetical protein
MQISNKIKINMKINKYKWSKIQTNNPTIQFKMSKKIGCLEQSSSLFLIVK